MTDSHTTVSIAVFNLSLVEGWNIVSLHACEVPDTFTDWDVSIAYHPLPSGSYESFIVGLLHTDFLLVSGEG
jgi:hypothetical protein